MALKLKYALAANRLIRDAQQNTVSAIDIIEDIAMPAFPGMYPRVDVVMVFEREPSDQDTYEAEIRLNHNGSVLFSGKNQIRFKDKMKSRSFISMAPLPVPGPGSLKIQCWIEDDLKGEVSLDIRAVQVNMKVEQME